MFFWFRFTKGDVIDLVSSCAVAFQVRAAVAGVHGGCEVLPRSFPERDSRSADGPQSIPS